MGVNQSVYEEGGPEDIKIVVESGLTGGNPTIKGGRRWHGTVVATIFVKRDSTVAAFLGTIKNISLGRGHPQITLQSIHMGNFKPEATDLFRTVSDMGLESGTLRLYNGMDD